VTLRVATALVVCILLVGAPLTLAPTGAATETPATGDSVVQGLDSSPSTTDQQHRSTEPPRLSSDVSGQSPSTLGVQSPPETDATVTRVRVLSNGTAVWSLTVRMRLASEDDEQAFAAFQDEFAANRSAFLGDYRERMQGVVSAAETVTDREMSATAFTAETGTETVPRRWGYVAYEFRWAGFASVENGTVRLGDVFEDGLFLEDEDILVVDSPDGHEPTAVAPDPDETSNGTLRWYGPVTFDDRRPTASFDPTGDDGAGDGDTGDGGGDGGDQNGEGPDGSALSLPVAVGAAGFVALAGAGVFYLRRRARSGAGDDTTDDSKTDTADDSETDHGGADDETGAGNRVDGTTGAGDAAAAGAVPDLATDEDRVVATLAEAGGRMKQSDLADELDWSASKTSRVLSDMAADGRVEKLRIGRENVIDIVEEG